MCWALNHQNIIEMAQRHISFSILYPVWLNRRHKRVMFTEMSNSRSSGNPIMNVTKNGVDGVIYLNCLVESWVWRSLIPNLLFIFLVFIIIIPPLINVLLLRWLIVLIFILFFLSLIIILSWWRCLHGR
jgi:hypothetical protein